VQEFQAQLHSVREDVGGYRSGPVRVSWFPVHPYAPAAD